MQVAALGSQAAEAALHTPWLPAGVERRITASAPGCL